MEPRKGFEDDGTQTLTCEFNYAELDPAEPDQNDAIYLACEECRRVFEWMWQPQPTGFPNRDGLFVRSIIVAWVFVPQLRSYSMTHMASAFGLKKQSLGRWTDDFKRTFPELKKLQHFRNQ